MSKATKNQVFGCLHVCFHDMRLLKTNKDCLCHICTTIQPSVIQTVPSVRPCTAWMLSQCYPSFFKVVSHVTGCHVNTCHIHTMPACSPSMEGVWHFPCPLPNATAISTWYTTFATLSKTINTSWDSWPAVRIGRLLYRNQLCEFDKVLSVISNLLTN